MATRALGAGEVRLASSPVVLVTLLSAAVFLSYIDRGLLAIAGPLIKEELGLSATAFGIAVSAFFWVYAPGQLFGGWLVDRFSVYRLFALGLLIWAVVTALMGIAAGFASLVVLRVLLGVGQSFAFPGSSKMIAHHCTASQRGLANGCVMAGLAAGQAIAAFVGGLIMAAFGWRAMCVFFGLLTLLWLVPWQRMQLPEVKAAVPGAAIPQISFRELFRQRALWGSCAGHFCNNYGFYFIITWLPLYLVAERGMSIEAMAMLTASVFAVQTVSALASGWISDRLVVMGRPEGPVRKALIVGANIVKAAAIIGIGMAQSHAGLVGWLMLTGITIGITSPQNFAIPQIFAGPFAAGRWVGTQNFAANLAGITGPVITGMLIDATGNYAQAFALAGAITLASAFCWVVIVPRVEPIRWGAAGLHDAA